jgi:hypothetical protein
LSQVLTVLRRILLLASLPLVVVVVALVLGNGGDSQQRHMLPEPITVTAYPFASLRTDGATPSASGPLTFIGGMELRGAHANFGGLSGFRLNRLGTEFLAVTDTGDWITGTLEYAGGKPSGFSGVTIAPVLGPRGMRAKDIGLWDSESIARDGDTIFVGIEREHTVLRFDWSKGGLRSQGTLVPLPPYVANWPPNRGIEALGIFPPGTPYAGRLIGLSERSGARDDPTEGFVMKPDGSEAFRIRLQRSEGFDITDLDFLPNGDMVVLERYFTPIGGVAMRLRRVRAGDIRPEAMLSGETMLQAGRGFQIDNMEGLSIHTNGAGEIIFTLISDDNFSIVQRTLLLQFSYKPN